MQKLSWQIRVHTKANPWKFVFFFFNHIASKFARKFCCIALQSVADEKSKRCSVSFSQSDGFMASEPLSGFLFATAHQPIREQETAELWYKKTPYFKGFQRAA